MSEKTPNQLNSSQTVVKDESLSFTNTSLKTSVSSLKKNKKSEVINPELEKVGNSPGNRFIKYSAIVGRGSFKTVYKSLDTQTGKMVAWCELN
ncbi:MAG: Protein tyrosine kinase, partial [Paramarteilia canceri]